MLWLAGEVGTIKTPETSNPLNAQTASSAKATNNAHAIHRLWNMKSERTKVAATTTPNRGNATGPYVKASRLTVGKLRRISIPSKTDPNLTAAQPIQQKATRKPIATAHD